MSILSTSDLEARYRAYIDILNTQNWTELPSFLSEGVVHNNEHKGYEGYRNLIPPKTTFTVEDVLASVEKKEIGARLGIVVDGKKLREHVFYRWVVGGEGLWVIERVWSIVEEVKE